MRLRNDPPPRLPALFYRPITWASGAALLACLFGMAHWAYGSVLQSGASEVMHAAFLGSTVPFAFTSPPAKATPSPCPSNMQLVAGAYCVDRYEASTEEILGDGRVVAHSPYLSVRGLRVRAVSRAGVVPQAYISRNEAAAACGEAHKRLCRDDEWVRACRGAESTRYPYGNDRQANVCVDTRRVSPLDKLFGQDPERYQPEPMNDPRLNQLERTVAPTGSFSHCTNSFHVYDMVGNVHEWTADPAGTFRGGYYLDTKINGEGCDYRTVAHAPTYHDYSTGFRCCADPVSSDDTAD